MSDRLRFRVWDKRLNRYLDKYDPTPMLMDNGNLAYLNDEGMVFYNIEQCTGLKDKNGKLIYEGDILKVVVYDKNNYCKKETNWSVEYKIYGNCGGFLVYGIDRRWHQLLTFNMIFNCEAVIVGNIHENADLLEKKND